MIVQLCKYTRKYWIVQFKWVNFMMLIKAQNRYGKKEFKWGIVRNNLKESLYGHRCKSFSSIIVIINEPNSMIFTSLVSMSHLKTWKGRQTIRYWPPKTSTNLCVAETTTYLISCLYLPSIFYIVSTVYLDLYLFIFLSFPT